MLANLSKSAEADRADGVLSSSILTGDFFGELCCWKRADSRTDLSAFCELKVMPASAVTPNEIADAPTSSSNSLCR